MLSVLRQRLLAKISGSESVFELSLVTSATILWTLCQLHLAILPRGRQARFAARIGHRER